MNLVSMIADSFSYVQVSPLFPHFQENESATVLTDGDVIMHFYIDMCEDHLQEDPIGYIYSFICKKKKKRWNLFNLATNSLSSSGS